MTGRPTAPPVTAAVPIDHRSAVHLAATTARGAALDCGLPGSLPDQAATVASELASNLDKHAVDGVVYVQPLPDAVGVEVLAVDRGPGMAEPERCLVDGYSTTGTLGTGLGAVRRIADRFSLRSRPGHGTVAGARITRPGVPSPTGAGDRAGAVCLPARGEDVCGDGYAVHPADQGGCTAAVVDGLGHGADAAQAARLALRALRGVHDQPLTGIMQTLHRALRHTRGAAVGLLRLSPGRAEYCGVGNIRLCLLSAHEIERSVDGRPGIVGWNMPTPRTHTLPLASGQVTVMHSDGIESRWARRTDGFLLRLPPPLLPAALTHHHRRHRDDATALSLSGPR
ncbi:SpoIIE family protein phosphatase [Streptomyces sp. TR06-5]|uniref:SpoIIE family protein phosphatase n=1 Tax=unclassified Streptomyces TaxID=2593676 RepID=UPI0039A07034